MFFQIKMYKWAAITLAGVSYSKILNIPSRASGLVLYETWTVQYCYVTKLALEAHVMYLGL